MSWTGEMQVSFCWQIKLSHFGGVSVHINTRKNKKRYLGTSSETASLKGGWKETLPVLEGLENNVEKWICH